MIQHLIFVIFYICEKLEKEGVIETGNNKVVEDIYIIGSVTAMLTVISGGML